MADPKVSIIIPVYNEQDNVGVLAKEMVAVMRKTGLPFELIFVNDGSSDSTRVNLAALTQEHSELIVLNLEKNLGQSLAVEQGFKLSRADIVVNLDGDCQNDPADIPLLLDALKQADLATGVRKSRQDNMVKKVSAKIAFFIRNAVLRDGMLDIGCGMRAYKKAAVNGLKWFNGIHRFLPALVKFKGLKVAQIEVSHRPRKSGKSHYSTLRRAFKGFKDLIYVAQVKHKMLKGDN